MSLNETIPTLEGDASFGAYLARPEGTPRAAIIVIQEIFGVNPGIRRKCDKLAAEGYLALAPDLFWRLQPGFEADPDIESEFQTALEMMGRFDQDLAIRDIEACIHHIRRTLGIAKVGCVGYCLGGRLAFLAAARTDIDASVGYYGVGIDGLLGEKHAIANPLMLHIPTADGFVPRETQAAMHAGLDDHPKVTLYDYEGLDHGFATEMGKRRVEEAAQLADRRTAAFFAEHLG
ncbi:dienelactone hydrolase family protein [Erythrobacter cryptus]|uniref:dienelactone hydrolase family protein n=1 Tax=Erythrobacter cryptus TaxID=196588 RepID=UPI0004013B41|nr:dienelactone hydrolase family protein [Erythrobacter cryptus]GIX20866.1 MAG: carboxymethylenebutenolidase [Erythrobacter sp.]